MTRIYLDEHAMPANPSPGLSILQLVTAPDTEIRMLVDGLKQKAENEIADRELGKKVIELTEELLLRRFTQLDREEIRKMFGLQDIRKSKVWQEAHEEGREEGIQKGENLANIKLIRKWLAQGKSVKVIAELMDISVREVRRLAKDAAK